MKYTLLNKWSREKIVRLLLLPEATNTESQGIFFALKCVKTYLRRSLWHGFNSVNTRFLVQVIFFPIKFSRKIHLYGKFIDKTVLLQFSTLYLLKSDPHLLKKIMLFALLKAL